LGIDGERDVLAFVLAGLLNGQIAARLGVSEVTVKMWRANIVAGSKLAIHFRVVARKWPELP
jgi:FixJ family two-component response regulator